MHVPGNEEGRSKPAFGKRREDRSGDFADHLHGQSRGLFDITSGVLRRAWDFHQARVPTDAELAPSAGRRLTLQIEDAGVASGAAAWNMAVKRVETQRQLSTLLERQLNASPVARSGSRRSLLVLATFDIADAAGLLERGRG